MWVLLGYRYEAEIAHLQFWELHKRYVVLQRDRWSHTSYILAMIHNANFARNKGDCVTPDDYNPYKQQEQTEGTIDDLKFLLG